MSRAPCYCPCCRAVIDDFVEGGAVSKRPRGRCPNCNSLERHRLAALVFDGLAPTLAAARVVLDIAPTPAVSNGLARETGGLHLTCDVDPAADRRDVILQANLEALPLADGAADVVVCMQVLEHVHDDAAAMREIRRVLAPGGVALVNVPFRAGTLTDEDPSAPPEERLRRFGQEDHVRFYGDDFDDRLRAAGLEFARTTSGELCGEELVYRLGLSAPEAFWFVWRDDVGAAPGLPRLDAVRTFAVLSANVSGSLRGALTPWLRTHLPAPVVDRLRRVRARVRHR